MSSELVIRRNSLRMTELFQSTTSRENLHNRDLNVVDRSLEQRRKATIQEGVKKFHLCLCLVTNTSVPVSVFVVVSFFLLEL